jgi:hypothetical protein
LGFYFIGTRPGIAALRVLRLFRFFAYLKYINDDGDDDEDAEDYVPPKKRLFSLVKAAKLFSFYMEQLYEEFATQKSSGGLLVVSIFFFTTYVVAVVLWNEKGDTITPAGTPCYHLKDCFLTMMRLCVYDGVGFDFLQELFDSAHSGGYVAILFFYTIFNGIILINGLIGIFGQTFTTSDETVEETLLRMKKIDKKMNYIVFLLQKGGITDGLDTAVNTTDQRPAGEGRITFAANKLAETEGLFSSIDAISNKRENPMKEIPNSELPHSDL